MSAAWWRRNRVALPVMVVALAGLAWPGSEAARDLWWPRGEHVPVSPGGSGDSSSGDGWATVGDVSLRLAAFGPADELPDDPPPDGYAVWRAELAADGDRDEPLACTAQLQDADGNRYTAGSRHLPSYEDESVGVECGGPEGGGVVYFLLPGGAEPDAVRVSALELLPEYWALPVP
ncbi:hypothetical protein [Jiangella alkaliphila]|uniref:DUF4352 domain-containing protein n=1 Tax=Jiangella alkaliphila TaxID=419479 RepID=A0A1H2KU68_9ACTN|nr:hypothetical protein [Jiangella alkaliphila]SDU71858.1 hypothetical protein SAMN04488563_4253 [Jiangella alkaliphila]